MKALIFDYDGLIVDSERIIADSFIRVLADVGGTVVLDDLAHLFGTTEADHLWDELIAARCSLTPAEVLERMRPLVRAGRAGLPVLPGVLELLAAARSAGRRTGLGTGSERSDIEPHLVRLGLDFDAVVTRDDVRRGKPAPDIYLEVARRLGVDPVDCLVLEDSVPGCEAALAAGMQVIACPSAVTAGLSYPAGVACVKSLLEVDIGCEPDIEPPRRA